MSTLVLLVLACVALLLVLLVLAFHFFSFHSFAPWMPARANDSEAICELSSLHDGEIFYDLGCGDGRVVDFVSRNFAVEAVGIEIQPIFYAICLIRKLFNPKSIFKFKNLFDEDLSRADVVYFFGMPNQVNKKLLPKLKRELKPGTRVVSNTFGIEDWEPIQTYKYDSKTSNLYLYIKK